MSVFFGGAKPPPNSCRFRGRFGPGSDFAGDFGAYFGAPLSVGEGGRTRPRLPPLSLLPWGGGAKRAPKVPPVFATVGRSTDCTAGAFEHRKGSYPLSHVSYSRRRTGTSPRPRPPGASPPAAGSARAPSPGSLRPRRSGSPAPATSVCESRGWPTGSRRGRRRPPSSPPSSAPRNPWSPRGSGRGRSS